MKQFNLSKAEIAALAERNTDPDFGYDQELSAFFQAMNGLLERHLSHILGTKTTIDGFYVEKITSDLDNIIKGNAYVFPIELLAGDSYLMITESDAIVIGDYLNVSIQQGINLILDEFMLVLTDYISDQTSYWQMPASYPAVLMNVNQIKSLSVGPSHFARYNVYCDSTGFEIIHFLPKQFIHKILVGEPSIDYIQHRTVSEENSMRVQKPKKLNVKSFKFEDIADSQKDVHQNEIELVNDVNLEVVAELGQSTMTLGELMELASGDIITLDKSAGEPADVYVNKELIARAEVSVLENYFGLRILEITDARNRIKY